MSVCVRCYEMMCCEFEEVWITSAALERVPVCCKKCHRRSSALSTGSALTMSKSEMPAALAASESGSEGSMALGRKKL